MYPSCARETLDAALAEYNAANAVMDLVLFDEVRWVCSFGAFEARMQAVIEEFYIMMLTELSQQSSRHTS